MCLLPKLSCRVARFSRIGPDRLPPTDHVLPFIYEPPDSLQKSDGALNTGFVPNQFVFDQSRKKAKEPAGIRAKKTATTVI
jgi:hypothetical protein